MRDGVKVEAEILEHGKLPDPIIEALEDLKKRISNLELEFHTKKQT